MTGLTAHPGLIALAFMGGMMGVCAFYRVLRGLPVFFFSVSGADFLENAVSGHGYRNCLVVAIASGRLVVRPFFPFNLFFPDLQGVDIDVPVEDIAYVESPAGSQNALSRFIPVGTNIEICVRLGHLRTRTLELRLANPEAFVRLLTSRTRLPGKRDSHG
ncbi:MAG TPA: hypothetical protein VFK05_28695 [Polyangiaceae bacterium]|nr:hypothetical protein [Polyangiaceae bacterium]